MLTWQEKYEIGWGRKDFDPLRKLHQDYVNARGGLIEYPGVPQIKTSIGMGLAIMEARDDQENSRLDSTE